MNIQGLIEKIHAVVDSHKLSEGVYCRWRWQDEKNSRQLGVNEYGCADAANILYTIGDFPREPEKRVKWVETLQKMQNPETGLFTEATHHTIHTTAHCLAALELFDAQPLYPLTALEKYLDPDALKEFLNGLDWDYTPWPTSHQGAGLYAAMAITRSCNADWQKTYFSWLREHADPSTALGLKDRRGDAPLYCQLNGWFHYLFNHEYARQPIPYPERVIDSCIDLYRKKQLSDNFNAEIGFKEIDWIFAMNRASRQTPHRFREVKNYLKDCADHFIPYMEGLDPDTDEGMNDLHMLFGAVCALAELQLALPGYIETDVPMKIVLDRRPFI